MMNKIDIAPEYMLLDEAAAYLRTTTKKIAMYRKHGLLKAGKLGKSYIYRREWLDSFANQWAGYDLSNESKIINAIAEKSWRAKHGRN